MADSPRLRINTIWYQRNTSWPIHKPVCSPTQALFAGTFWIHSDTHRLDVKVRFSLREADEDNPSPRGAPPHPEGPP